MHVFFSTNIQIFLQAEISMSGVYSLHKMKLFVTDLIYSVHPTPVAFHTIVMLYSTLFSPPNQCPIIVITVNKYIVYFCMYSVFFFLT